YFSEALSAKVESVFSDDRTVLAASFAWAGPFAIFPLFPWFDFGHVGSACYICAEVALHERYCFRPRHVVVVPYLGRAYSAGSDPVSRAPQSDVNGCSEYSYLGDVPGSGDFDMLLDSE